MTAKHPSCVRLEDDLLATAMGEADTAAETRVQEHVDRCRPCRDELEGYREVGAVVGQLRDSGRDVDAVGAVPATLTERLADLRRRLVLYRIFPSPLGNLLIARSEVGVSLVEYLGEATSIRASRLATVKGLEAEEDGAEIEALYHELLDYLGGRRTRLDWALDLGLARGEFDRRVLAATSAIPYGAVTSYAGIARALGKPSAVRAVAQALRWNPLPLAIPCHRVIGNSGSLVGYAGSKVGLKQRLLSLEGVRLRALRRDARVAREAMYVTPRGDTEYCLPTCGALARRSLAELLLFGSREHAEDAGLRPCTACRPDLHPLASV